MTQSLPPPHTDDEMDDSSLGFENLGRLLPIDAKSILHKPRRDMSDATTATPSDAAAPEAVSNAASPSGGTHQQAGGTPLERLPSYTQNLLNIGVPVSVTLAAKKQPLKQIMELAPGSLIQFEKPCDQLLDLCVGDQRVAQGLAVKVGEKFGLKINNLTPPAERLQSLRPQD